MSKTKGVLRIKMEVEANIALKHVCFLFSS